MFVPPKRSKFHLIQQDAPKIHRIAAVTGGLDRIFRQIRYHTTPHSALQSQDGRYTQDHVFSPQPGMPLLASRYRFLHTLGRGQSSLFIKVEDLFQSGVIRGAKVLHTNYRNLGVQESDCIRRLNTADPYCTVPTLRLCNTFMFHGHYCMVFELLTPDPLTYYFRELRPQKLLPSIRKVAILLLKVLAFLQNQNTIHADLKPANILLEEENNFNTLKVVDFGNSIRCVNEEISLYFCDFELQTLLYRAPEVVYGLPFGLEVDMWSLGCILGELFINRPLFQGRNKLEVLDDMTELMGPLPEDIFRRGKFYTDLSKFTSRNSEKCAATTPEIMSKLECRDYAFVDFLRLLLQYNPNERMTVSEATRHPFLAREIPILPCHSNETRLPAVLIDHINYTKRPFIEEQIKQHCPDSIELLHMGTTLQYHSDGEQKYTPLIETNKALDKKRNKRFRDPGLIVLERKKSPAHKAFRQSNQKSSVSGSINQKERETKVASKSTTHWVSKSERKEANSKISRRSIDFSMEDNMEKRTAAESQLSKNDIVKLPETYLSTSPVAEEKLLDNQRRQKSVTNDYSHSKELKEEIEECDNHSARDYHQRLFSPRKTNNVKTSSKSISGRYMSPSYHQTDESISLKIKKEPDSSEHDSRKESTPQVGRTQRKRPTPKSRRLASPAGPSTTIKRVPTLDSGNAGDEEKTLPKQQTTLRQRSKKYLYSYGDNPEQEAEASPDQNFNTSADDRNLGSTFSLGQRTLASKVPTNEYLQEYSGSSSSSPLSSCDNLDETVQFSEKIDKENETYMCDPGVVVNKRKNESGGSRFISLTNPDGDRFTATVGASARYEQPTGGNRSNLPKLTSSQKKVLGALKKSQSTSAALGVGSPKNVSYSKSNSASLRKRKGYGLEPVVKKKSRTRANESCSETTWSPEQQRTDRRNQEQTNASRRQSYVGRDNKDRGTNRLDDEEWTSSDDDKMDETYSPQRYLQNAVSPLNRNHSPFRNRRTFGRSSAKKGQRNESRQTSSDRYPSDRTTPKSSGKKSRVSPESPPYDEVMLL